MRTLIIFLICFGVNAQTPDWFQESRLIKYEQLNEVLKLANYKVQAENVIISQQAQIAIQDSIIQAQRGIIQRYEQRVLPNLQEQVRLYETQLKAESELSAIREEKAELKYKALKAKRLGLSAYAGYGATPINLQPSVGLAITYTFIRF